MTHDYYLEDSDLKNRYHIRQKVREQRRCVSSLSKDLKRQAKSILRDTEQASAQGWERRPPPPEKEERVSPKLTKIYIRPTPLSI